ncbi:NADH-quinone oxidoreductase subunit C [Planosporangium thailandense]|uniref:NADH-quinone oxidoreductase subunit C n=1 Tax=Planosporangium thailandense TaxID=765197 RepID=A0ABX0XVM1_9ACTN|nr:NADH-quinone oxidoreductase subunit C [Planosporangium thailandense]NJC70086.1 NADH-quinone oxidoreductase subunit C [Planosporangium thailandense]
MTPEEVGARMSGLLGGDGDDAPVVSVSGGNGWARGTVDVPPSRWHDALRAARDDAELGCDFFDWLSAVDELDAGFRVVAHLWSTTRRHGVLVRTLIGGDAPAIASVVDLYPGAAWHERETHEMFGIDFPGHPGLTPLLLPPEFEGHPLRKEFVLASRVAKPWPGAKEPGESHDTTAAKRQPMRPPGVPEPGTWGPHAGEEPARPARAPRERPARPAPGRAERPERPEADGGAGPDGES